MGYGCYGMSTDPAAEAWASALRRQDDAEENTLVRTYLSRSANVRTTIGRDHVIYLVLRNWHPFAVNLDFIVVANHATLGWATIHQVAARTSSVIPF